MFSITSIFTSQKRLREQVVKAWDGVRICLTDELGSLTGELSTPNIGYPSGHKGMPTLILIFVLTRLIFMNASLDSLSPFINMQDS